MSMRRDIRKKDVQIDGLYVAKISGKLTVVKIVGEVHRVADGKFSHWQADNLWTGHRVAIKSAQKLRLDLSYFLQKSDKQTACLGQAIADHIINELFPGKTLEAM